MKPYPCAPLFALLLLLPALHAQEPASPTSPEVAWREELAGINDLGGRTLATGSRYLAEFDEHGLTFIPALGPASPRAHELSFHLERIERGAQVLHAAEATAPQVQQGSVLYRRGGSIEERYEARPDGIHQTFLLREPLPGSGDLVVRGRLSTTLDEVLAAPGGGLDFRAGDLGGVSYGGVTGIDAAGRTAPGSLRLDGGELELVLPGSFLDAARYPVLLDPLVGTLITLSTTANVSEPCVAYDQTNDVYLSVWSYQAAAAVYWLRGALIDAATGASTLYTFEMGSSVTYQPSVGNVNQTDRFLVAYRSDLGAAAQQVRALSVDPATGAASAFAVVGAGVVDHTTPDVGGVRHTAGNAALVVWKEDLFGLRGARVTVGAGAPVVASTFTVTADPADADPAVSHAGGAADEYLVVWERNFDIFGVGLDVAGTVLAPALEITLSLTTNEKQKPDVDGDGTDFLVAYERAESAGAGVFDVYVVPVSIVAGALVRGDFVAVEDDAGEDEIQPALAWAGAKSFISYSAFITTSHNLHTRGLESGTGEVCETVPATGTAGDDVEPCLCAQYAGDPAAGDGLLLVWKGDLIEGQMLEAFGGGPIAGLGGGCMGGGGIFAAGPAAIGNPDFRLVLAGAAVPVTGANGWLSLCTGGAGTFGCGACATILPFAFTTIPAAVSAAGAASANVPIPCEPSLAGFIVEAQWMVYPTLFMPCPFAPGAATTNRLQITLAF